MNKKFSTLLASVLLASAFSTSAYAAITAGVPKAVEGKTLALYDQASGAYVLSLKADGTLEKLTASNVFHTTAETYKSSADVADGTAELTSFDSARRALWKVASVKFDQTSGEPIYQFVNRMTGAYLAINLVTDKNGESETSVKLNAAGNKNWSINGDGVLYAYAKDSIYTIVNSGTEFKLKAQKKTEVGQEITGYAIGVQYDIDKEKNLPLTAEAFNDMLAMKGADGKLHFNNGKDVSAGEKNLLTEEKYVAYATNKTANLTTFFLAQKDKATEINKNPYVLVVDKNQYAPAANQFFKFAIDTLAISKEAAEAVIKGTSATNPELEYKQANYNHPVATATFSANYYYANDSIALSVAGVPAAYVAKNFAVTNGTNAWSTLAVNSNENNNPATSTAGKIKAYSDYAETMNDAVKNLKKAVDNWIDKVRAQNAAETTGQLQFAFADTYFTSDCAVYEGTGSGQKKASEDGGVLYAAEQYANSRQAKDKEKDFVAAVKGLKRYTVTDEQVGTYFVKGMPAPAVTGGTQSPYILSFSDTKVLTVGDAGTRGIKPLVQPFATSGGDAAITTSTKLYRIQIANTAKDAALRATADNSKYLVATGLETGDKTTLVESVDDANVYAQWAFIPGEAGFYQIINRGSEYSLYSGPVSKVKDANGNVVADTYVLGADTVKLAGVTVTPNVYEEKEGNSTVKYDYSGYFYAGPTKDKSYTFSIAPVAAIMNDLGAQFNKDSVMVLGKADEAPVWYFQEAEAKTYGLEIEGMTQLKYMTYKIFTKNANGDSLYVYAKNNKYYVTNKGAEPVAFALREANKGQYLFLEGDSKMTINPTPAQPVLEQSAVATMRDDYFTITSASSNAYRTLTEEDGVLGNAKIFMNNEPYRYLYENTANIVANNGNKIAKDSLNFLGIYNAAASSKNAALYVDTAYVNRKGVTMPQYMFALGVEDHEATPAANCTESGVHVDKDGKPTTADKCVHATPAKKAYKTGRYLVSVADSASTAKHPAKYDGAYRLAFVEAIHVEGSDSLIIVNSKYTNNTNAITEGKETTYASKDTLKFENDKPNVATFALLIKDQADKSFYLETANKTYVRILNGVPVLTDNIENAAIFNIEATTEEATANEAIEAAGVQVIGGQGVVTVQGAAGKVITVANILGQTIANQVAASDNVTIAAPAGIVVVAVEGEATKVVVK